MGAPSSGPSAEGYYAGTLAVVDSGNIAVPGSSTSFQMLVLENGQFWTIYGTANGTSLDVEGFAQGTGTSSGGLFTSFAVRNFAKAPPAPATDATAFIRYNAAARSISGTIADAPTTSTITSAPQSVYDYNAAATLASLTGAPWTVRGPANDEYTLSVLADGTFTSTPTTVPGCTFSGTFVPRPSGKNVFNVSVINGASPCRLAGLPSEGVAYLVPAGAGTQLTFATMSADRQLGAVLSGVRP